MVAPIRKGISRVGIGRLATLSARLAPTPDAFRMLPSAPPAATTNTIEDLLTCFESVAGNNDHSLLFLANHAVLDQFGRTGKSGAGSGFDIEALLHDLFQGLSHILFHTSCIRTS